MPEPQPSQPSSPRAHIEAGNLVEHGGRSYQIKEVVDLSTVTAIDRETHETKVLPLAELQVVKQALGGVHVRALDDVAPEEEEIAKERLKAIQPLLDMPRFGRKDVEARAAEVSKSPETLYRWIRRYTGFRDHTSLVSHKRGRKKGSKWLAKPVERVIDEVIENFYLTPERPGPDRTIEEVEKECLNKNIKAPSHSAIRARLASIDEEERLRRRGEPDRAKRSYGAATGHFPNADFPLAAVQIDHTRADVILVDDIDREPIGRPWVTLSIDVCSRVVTGYYLSFDDPSVLSVGMCMTHSILPKEDWLLRHGVEAKWPVWGFPGWFHADNGPDFRAEDIESSCLKHGINIEFRPVKVPEYGAHIERLIGTFMRKLKGIPGSTFSSVAERGEHDAEKYAAMTRSEFERWLLIRICKHYHRRKHRGINTTPLARWEHGLLGDKRTPGIGVPQRPPKPDDLVRDFLPSFQCTVQRDGVAVESRKYLAEVLRPWIRRPDPEDPKKTRQFTFRRDPRDISFLWFFDPNLKEYFKIPERDLSFPPMSIWEYRRARAHLNAQGIENHDTLQLARAVAEMREIEEDSKGKTKKAKRKRRNRQRRKDHAAAVTPASPNEPAPPPETIAVNEFSDGPIEAFDTIR